MSSKNKTVSFRTTNKITEWVDNIKDQFELKGQEFNQSDYIRDTLENMIQSPLDSLTALNERMADQKDVLHQIYKRLDDNNAFFDPGEVFYLFYQAHKAYLGYKCEKVAAKPVKDLLTVFKSILETASSEGWMPHDEDVYFLQNLRGEDDPTQSLYDRLIASTQSTIDILSEHNHYCRSAAEIHARNLEVVLKRIPLSAETINKSVKGLLEPVFSLAVVAYQMQKGEELTFIDTDSFAIPEGPYFYKQGGCKLGVTPCENRILAFLELENKDINIGLQWSTVYEWHRAFAHQSLITSNIKLIRNQQDLSVMIDYLGTGLHIYLSAAEIESIGKIFNDFMIDPKQANAIRLCKLLYGFI